MFRTISRCNVAEQQKKTEKEHFWNDGYEIVVYCRKIHLAGAIFGGSEPEPPKIERLRNCVSNSINIYVAELEHISFRIRL